MNMYFCFENTDISMKQYLSLLFLLFFSASNYAQSIETIADSVIIKDTTIWGIDISKYQRVINWDTLCYYNKPYFLYHKSSEGLTIVDTLYKKRKQICKELQIPYGAYHFFSYRSPGALQFQKFLLIADVQKGDLIPVLDVEIIRHMPHRSWIIREIKSFCKAFETHFGYKPIIYCNYSYYNTYLKGHLDGYRYWICDIRNPRPKLNFIIWQHSNTTKLKGIKGNIDHNFFNGSLEELNSIIVQ